MKILNKLVFKWHFGTLKCIKSIYNNSLGSVPFFKNSAVLLESIVKIGKNSADSSKRHCFWHYGTVQCRFSTVLSSTKIKSYKYKTRNSAEKGQNKIGFRIASSEVRLCKLKY
jgi:ribosomal protein L21